MLLEQIASEMDQSKTKVRPSVSTVTLLLSVLSSFYRVPIGIQKKQFHDISMINNVTTMTI